MTQSDAESPENGPATAKQVAIALDVIRGEMTQEQVADAHGVSRSTVTRVAAEEWFAELRAEVVSKAVDAVKSKFVDVAGAIADRLIEIAGDTRATSAESSRKACLDILNAAGADLGDQRAARIEIV